MPFSVQEVAQYPETLTRQLQFGDKSLTARPLEEADAPLLATFLESLSDKTRAFSVFPAYDMAEAKEMCKAIGQYDKLRLILEDKQQIIALIEFSFAITREDEDVFNDYDIQLDEETDCRFGPTVLDAYQNQGIGSLMFPYVREIAKAFGKRRIILWGGVFWNNETAIAYYKKQGFLVVGSSLDSKGEEMLDMILDLG